MGTQGPVALHISSVPELRWAYQYGDRPLIGDSRKTCITAISSHWPNNYGSMTLYYLEGEYWMPKVFIPIEEVCGKCFSRQSRHSLRAMSVERPKFLAQMWCSDCYKQWEQDPNRELPPPRDESHFYLDHNFSWYAKK